jgi:hypothetical protein
MIACRRALPGRIHRNLSRSFCGMPDERSKNWTGRWPSFRRGANSKTEDTRLRARSQIFAGGPGTVDIGSDRPGDFTILKNRQEPGDLPGSFCLSIERVPRVTYTRRMKITGKLSIAQNRSDLKYAIKGGNYCEGAAFCWCFTSRYHIPENIGKTLKSEGFGLKITRSVWSNYAHLSSGDD